MRYMMTVAKGGERMGHEKMWLTVRGESEETVIVLELKVVRMQIRVTGR